MSNNIFPSLRAAIASWYSSKVAPQITVTKCDETIVGGRLHTYADLNIAVEPEGLPKERRIIPVDNIQQVDLTWCEGEPPTTIWEHRITRRPDGSWVFEEISKT